MSILGMSRGNQELKKIAEALQACAQCWENTRDSTGFPPTAAQIGV